VNSEVDNRVRRDLSERRTRKNGSGVQGVTHV
jgi:hypothetical protein